MIGETYIDTYGRVHTISKVLSSGGQGIVYRTDEANTLLKLEWNSKTKEIIRDISKNEKFDEIRLLPLQVNTNITLPQVTLRDVAGYTMKLLDGMESFKEAFSGDNKQLCNNSWLEEMEKQNQKIGEELKKYISSGGMRKRLNAYLEAACILAKIHVSGLVYCDVSDKNMFVSSDIDVANVWFIDCDNLNFMKNTASNTGWSTPGFGAPEVIQGKGNTMYSDSYSFAIALFWTLVGKHPFMGHSVDEALENEDFLEISEEEYACSGRFPWIGDSQDNSNQSDKGLPYENFLSKEIQTYFQRTFGKDGIKNRQKRTTMPEWAYILAKETDHIVHCSKCEMQYPGSEYSECPWCDEKNKIITIKSWKSEVALEKEQWEFIREIKKEIDVPLRILEGFCADNIKECAFRVRISSNVIEMDHFNDKYEFSILTNGEKKIIYGSVKIKKMKNFDIFATQEKNGVGYHLKIEV